MVLLLLTAVAKSYHSYRLAQYHGLPGTRSLGASRRIAGCNRTGIEAPLNTVSTHSGTLLPGQQRYFSILGTRDFKPFQYTKYRITKPWSINSDFDDLYIAAPSRSDFATTTVEDPRVFLRFLKLVADQEGRSDDFRTFAHRCEAGLVVEKDVYITKEELLQNLWQNGFSEQELNAYEIGFPANHRFHAPELAVLFRLPEESCYKFALRQRAAKPEDLVELKHKPTSNKVISYALLSSAIWFGAQNNVLGNIWMMVKTWPFFAVFYMVASHFQKHIWGHFHNESSLECSVAKANQLEGEETVYKQIRSFANDGKCLDYVESFKDSVIRQISQFRQALALRYRDLFVEGVLRHLVAVQQSEKAIEAAVQQIIVTETTDAFLKDFKSSEQLQDEILDATLQMLISEHPKEPDETPIVDPLSNFFRNSLQRLRSFDWSSSPSELAVALRGEPAVVHRVVSEFQKQEQEFLDRFTVTPDDLKRIQEVKSLLRKRFPESWAKPRPSHGTASTVDLAKVNDSTCLGTVEELYRSIMQKIGLGTLPKFYKELSKLGTSSDLDATTYIEESNDFAEKAAAAVRDAQLSEFLNSFPAAA